MTLKREGESIPETGMQIEISADFRALFSQIEQNFAGTNHIVNDADIMAAITKSRGRATKVVSTMFLDNMSEFSNLLQSQSRSYKQDVVVGTCMVSASKQLQLSQSAAELLLLAQKHAKSENRPVLTDDFIFADLDRENSVLRLISGRLGNDPEISDLLLRELLKKNYSDELTDTEPLIYQELIPVVPKKLSSPISIFAAPDRKLAKDSNRTATVNWTEQARSGNLEPSVSRPDLVRKIISSFHDNTITVLVCDQPEEAEDLIRNTASELAKQQNQFLYSEIHMIDSISLTAVPEKAAVKAITAATGGTIYLPDADQYLSDNSDASAPFRTALEKKLIRVVTVLTQEEWNHVKGSFPFRKAKDIAVPAMNENEKKQYLLAQRSQLERQYSEKHALHITDEAIETVQNLCARYYVGGEVDLLRRALMNINFGLSDSADLKNPKIKNDDNVDPDDIVLALFEARGIVVNPDDPEKYANMEKTLETMVIGQDEAIAEVSKAIRRSIVGLNDPNKPRGRFMFLGPTGVGKSELAKALAQFLFDDRNALITLDMSEYMDKYTVARLIGAPPGYVGYEEGGQLTKQVKDKPYSVVLFDEIEKAHPDVMSLFLQILEEGRLTDGKGTKIDFRQTVVIMTGNVGTEFYEQEDRLGRAATVEAVKKAVKSTFRPEFLNRLDATIIFNSLGIEQIRQIADLKIAQVNARLVKQKGVQIQLTPQAKDYIVKQAVVPGTGARELDRVINDQISDQLALQILNSKISSGKTVQIDYSGGKMQFKVV